MFCTLLNLDASSGIVTSVSSTSEGVLLLKDATDRKRREREWHSAISARYGPTKNVNIFPKLYLARITTKLFTTASSHLPADICLSTLLFYPFQYWATTVALPILLAQICCTILINGQGNFKNAQISIVRRSYTHKCMKTDKLYILQKSI